MQEIIAYGVETVLLLLICPPHSSLVILITAIKDVAKFQLIFNISTQSKRSPKHCRTYSSLEQNRQSSENRCILKTCW